METIIDALKAMGKASSIEIAARLNMDRQEVISQLWELKRAEVVQQDGQGWKLAGELTPERDEKTETKAVSMKADDLIKIITEKGPITLEELAAAAGVTTRWVASTLAMPTSRGKVVRQKLGEKFHYMLPGRDLQPVTTPSAPASKTPELVPALAGNESSLQSEARSAPGSGPRENVAADSAPAVDPEPLAPASAEAAGDTETLTLPTIAHLRQRIRSQKNGARRDEQLLKHLVRVHRLMEINS